MEYFLHSEATNLKRTVSSHIGQEMVYNKNGDRAQLTNILVQKGQEIAHMGNIQLGYLVRFIFGLTANINQVDYCLFNGVEPVYGSKQALDEDTRKKIITKNNMTGYWLHKDGDDYVKIDILENEIVIETFRKGIKKKETISRHNNQWMGPLVFGNTGYYINFASATHLSFGRDYPNDNWVATFSRKN